MTFDYNRYRAQSVTDSDFPMTTPVVCADGLTMSVQASRTHYCTPRENGMAFYSHVEVGFPSERVEELMPYAEEPSAPTGTVYGWVPVEIVNAIVDAHGGEITQ